MVSPFENWYIRYRVCWSPRISKGTLRLADGHGWPHGEVADDEDGIFILNFVKRQGLGPRDFAHKSDTAPRRELLYGTGEKVLLHSRTASSKKTLTVQATRETSL